MANHKEINTDSPRIEQNEDGEFVLKGLQAEKLVTWVNGEERAEIHQDPDFDRQAVMSMDFDGLTLEDIAWAMFRKYLIDARGKFRDQMDPREAVAWVDGLPEDHVPEEGDCKRIEWRPAAGVASLFDGPKSASELMAEIEQGDHSPEELDRLINKLQQIREQQS